MSNAETVTRNGVTNAVSNGTPSYPTRPDPSRPVPAYKVSHWSPIHDLSPSARATTPPPVDNSRPGPLTVMDGASRRGLR